MSDEMAKKHVDNVLVETKRSHGNYIIYHYINFQAPLQILHACPTMSNGKGDTDMLKRIKFTTVPVQDQSRALDFYTNKLGLKIFTDQSMGDMRWIELQVPGADTLLVLFKQTQHEPGPMPAVVFVADNVQGTYEGLKAKGVEFTQPPKKEPWGESAILKDSEGNLVLFGTA